MRHLINVGARAGTDIATVSIPFALISCATSADLESDGDGRQPASTSATPSQTPDEPAEQVEVEPLSQQEQWVVNFNDNRGAFVRALSSSAGIRVNAEQAAVPHWSRAR